MCDMKKTVLALCAVWAGLALAAEKYVDIDGVGAKKFTVQVSVGNSAYTKSLARNLELSGLFEVKQGGQIKVTGASGAVKAEGGGKVLSSPESFADDKSARMAARRFSDTMCEAYGHQKGFACDKVIFLKRSAKKGASTTIPGEVCVCYPDGYDIRQLTSDAQASIFPRWKDTESVYYIGYLKGAPQILELNTLTGARRTKWSFKGSPTGIAVSPDGSKVAAILSFQGNPELYVIDAANNSWTRLTNTPQASEGQPTWSPDGRKIAYVSNETRYPQIYVVDVATKAKRRLTSKGRENVDPDWGRDGRIAYITKRGGAQVAVMSSSEGDASSELVTDAGSWEHPSWARDGRHVVANRDNALFVVDTAKDGDKPRRLFTAEGNWISPCWAK